MENGQNYSQNCLCNTNKFLSVFIYYSVIKICEILNCGTQKACKLLDELETFGALERRRQGLGKPNRLYLKKVF